MGILSDVKAFCDIPSNITDYDIEIAALIDAADKTVKQNLPDASYIPVTVDNNSPWPAYSESVGSFYKSFVLLKVRTDFNPSASAQIASAQKDILSERLERLSVEAESEEGVV